MSPPLCLDELYGLKNQFYLGSFQQVINDATNPSITPRTEVARLERKVYLYRAQIAQGRFSPALNEIKPSDAPELRAVQLFAKYLSTPDSHSKSEIISATQALVASTQSPSPLFSVIASTIFYYEGLLDDALRTLAPFPKHLEWLVDTRGRIVWKAKASYLSIHFAVWLWLCSATSNLTGLTWRRRRLPP
jgi:hypothetical protein